MIAAIYARKSTEQTGVSDEEKSVTRQIEHAKSYALNKGWTVSDDLMFVDDGISGAEFVKRPGFLRLMNALKPKPSFHVLVMSEESRLGREQIKTAYALQQLTDAGVQVWFYLSDQERKLDTAMDKLISSIKNFGGEFEREQAQQRTYDAMLRKAKAGHVTGGKTFGYDNRDVLSPDGHRLHVLRVVNQTEAAIVRQIFDWYASGLGLSRIAKRLNAEGTPGPRQSHLGWGPATVREMLRHPIYSGEIVWNAHQKIVRGGTKKRQQRAEKDWVRIPAPDLQIIPDALWAAVQGRIARATNQSLPIRRDRESRNLLTGLCRCAYCHGPMTVLGPGAHRRKQRYYACSYNKKRGSKICANSIIAEQGTVEKRLLGALADLLHPHAVDQAIALTLDQLRTNQGAHLDRRTDIERELSKIDAHKERLTDAIMQGEPVDTLLAKLKGEESRKQALVEELTRLDQAGPSKEPRPSGRGFLEHL